MKHYFLILLLLLTSCYNDSSYTKLKKMEQIKTLGNENPRKALDMLPTLKMSGEREYIWNKYDLLVIRLYDKANEKPTTDVVIKRLMEYFAKKGTPAEKQEVYYYAGSIYRDLQDTPRALGYFFKSLDYALAYKKECDPIMLRNTYSNLNWLLFRVQDYPSAVKFSIKELEMCKQTRTDVVLPFVHLGASYRAMDSIPQAMAMFDSAYAHIIQSGDLHRYKESIACLLYNYSDMEKTEKAKECIALIENNPLAEFDEVACMAFALYYEALGKNDSSLIYYKRVLDDATDFVNTYDAAGSLFRLYNKAGDETNALKYAKVYIHMCDSLNFGKRQELAATVNNQYKYHLDQKKEQELKDEKERYKTILLLLAPCSLLLLCIGYILYVRRRNRHLQEVVALSAELDRLSEEENRLREMVREKLEQNKTLMGLLHQSELDGKAEDVIHAIRQSSIGKGEMTAADWKRLYQAVGELHPTFKDRLLQELGDFTEQQMQVCYLMRIGLSKAQIQNMTNLSRSTVWRWVKKYDWVLSD